MTEFKEYRITWEIDVIAETPEEAVKQAIRFLEPIEPARWCYLAQDFKTGEVSRHEGQDLY